MGDESDPLDNEESTRGEAQPRDRRVAEEHADAAERLERHNAPARDSVGTSGPREPRGDAGRHADVPHGESGDAGNN